MNQAHVYISGFVQGVGFRAYVRSKARKLGLTGWVRNVSDGRVEAVIQGKRRTIEELIEYCEKGPFFSKPTHVVLDWEQEDEVFTEFVRRNTV